MEWNWVCKDTQFLLSEKKKFFKFAAYIAGKATDKVILFS